MQLLHSLLFFQIVEAAVLGDKVRHIKFGVGTVTNIVNGGRDFEVTVLFDTYGVKKLLASFANLKKC